MAYSSWWDYWLREARRWLRAITPHHVDEGTTLLVQWSDRECYLLLELRERVRTGELTGDTGGEG